MSNGRFVKRGRVYQGWAKRGWALAGSGVAAPVYTQRIRLLGTSLEVNRVIGTSTEVIRIVGAQQ